VIKHNSYIGMHLSVFGTLALAFMAWHPEDPAENADDCKPAFIDAVWYRRNHG